MSNLVGIKDKSPNEHLVRDLEELLGQAKAGDLRSAIFVLSWEDNKVNHGWRIDSRAERRRILGEVTLMQFEFITQTCLNEGDSILAKELYQSD